MKFLLIRHGETDWNTAGRIQGNTDAELREVCFGSWEGLCWEEVKNRFPEEFSFWPSNRRYGRLPSGESYQDLLDRFVPALQKIARKTPPEGGDVVIVTHSACIMSLLSLLNDTPFHEMAKRYRLPNTAAVEIDVKQLF